jgi:hypothetical protein
MFQVWLAEQIFVLKYGFEKAFQNAIKFWYLQPGDCNWFRLQYDAVASDQFLYETMGREPEIDEAIRDEEFERWLAANEPRLEEEWSHNHEIYSHS